MKLSPGSYRRSKWLCEADEILRIRAEYDRRSRVIPTGFLQLGTHVELFSRHAIGPKLYSWS